MTIDWTKPIEDCRRGYDGKEVELVKTSHFSGPGPFTRYVRFSNGDADWLTEDGKTHSCCPYASVRNRPVPPVEHDFGFPYEICGGDGGITADRRERARKLRDDLYDAFPWDATEDDFDFWLDVSKRLERIAWKGR